MESDPEQIKQVLWNLFLNAIEAMPDGGALHITTHLLDDQDGLANNGKMVEIKIRDTGEGFSDNSLSHLFTPFFTTKNEGSGLGLAIVKRVVEGLDGSIFGANHSDGGAEITILLQPSPTSSAQNRTN
ncbi:MAG: ATP-binding protein [Deltaproteobacteria bacterium]|nr:ATP-binding protein [Deltaproteobacteria bacterium]